MNRLMIILGLAATAAISAPASAQTNCRWWDVNCRTTSTRTDRTNTRIDGSWQVAGRDANGNTIYQRQRVDGNGNVVVERARRDQFGRYIIVDTRVAGRDVNRGIYGNVNRGRNRSEVRYGANGAICKYKENERGYKEDCKYPKPAKKLKKYKVARNDRVEDRRVNRDGVWYDVGNGRGKGKYKNH
jgi:hypothetical protein